MIFLGAATQHDALRFEKNTQVHHQKNRLAKFLATTPGVGVPRQGTLFSHFSATRGSAPQSFQGLQVLPEQNEQSLSNQAVTNATYSCKFALRYPILRLSPH